MAKIRHPTQKGTELFPDVVRVAPIVRAVGIDLKTPEGVYLWKQYMGRIDQFHARQLHNASLTVTNYYRAQEKISEDVYATYVNSQGQEIITVYFTDKPVKPLEEELKYNRSYWFMHPRINLTATPNRAYFDIPADTTLYPLDTIVLPASNPAKQGLPVTIRASGSMQYKNCGQDQGLAVVNSYPLAPHTVRFADSARTNNDLIFYKGVWFKLYDSAAGNTPRPFGMNKKYLFAALFLYSGNWALKYYMIPLTKLAEIAEKKKFIATDTSNNYLYTGYDYSGAGATLVRNSATQIECSGYSQGILANANEGNTFWDSNPYAFWPHPTDDKIWCASVDGAPSGNRPNAVKHYHVVTDPQTGIDSLQLLQTFPFTLASSATRGTTYTFGVKTRQEGRTGPVYNETDCGYPGHAYGWTEYDWQWAQLDYEIDQHRYNYTNEAGSVSTGVIPLYQIMPDGNPMTANVTKTFVSPTFYLKDYDDHQRQDFILDYPSYNCSTFQPIGESTYDYSEYTTDHETWNGSFTISAVYSWGRSYTLRETTFVADHLTTATTIFDGESVGSGSYTTLTGLTEKSGSASTHGEYPLAIDPTNKVQVWIDWQGGVDSRRTSFNNVFPAVSVTNTNYEAYLPLNIIQSDLRIQIGDVAEILDDTINLYSVTGNTLYEWDTSVPFTPSANNTLTEGGGNFTYTYDETPTVSYAPQSLPVPKLQESVGDGGAATAGCYLCTEKYLIVTCVAAVSSYVYGHGLGVYVADATNESYVHKVYALTRDDNKNIITATPVDIQTEFGIEAGAVFSWVFFA